MTLVSTIITDAFRQSNLIAIGTSETSVQQAEALRYLNRIVKSVFGNEVGDKLTAFPIGGINISRPVGYPWYNTVPDTVDWFVPKNVRLMFNLDQSINLYLHPAPNDGTRFAVNDVSASLATHPVTVYGNGRLIEGVQSVVLNTNSLERSWLFREDLANWLPYAPLIASDTFPFPEEFDDYFITLLALRLNPSFGISLDDQSALVLKRTGAQLRTRYRQDMPQGSEEALLRMPTMVRDRNYWDTYYYNPNSVFDSGWPR